LKSQAPHWAAWQHHFQAALQRTEGRLVCDQSVLNHALWTDQLPLHPLPARCNWVCHLALPHHEVADGKFYEPISPRQLLGILHLTHWTKDHQLPLAKGGSISLRYPGTAFAPPVTPPAVR
jgi:hypothetical protein